MKLIDINYIDQLRNIFIFIFNIKYLIFNI
jgi:hypothetical protein